MQEWESLLPAVVTIARQVGASILPYHGQMDKLAVQVKLDKTPLTMADTVAHDIAVTELAKISSLPIVSEESEPAAWSERQHWSQYWLIDPLDGTRGFIHGNDEFTVNIALIEKHEPILGVVYVPKLDVVYYAAKGQTAWKQEGGQAPQKLATRPFDWQYPYVVIGFYHNVAKLKHILADYPEHTLHKINSSLKFGLVAAGIADIYPRVGPTYEWDTAAGQCVLQAAGGIVVDLHGNVLQYNASESLSNPAFLALGDASQVEKVLAIFEAER